jgi:hypothetical protein
VRRLGLSLNTVDVGVCVDVVIDGAVDMSATVVVDLVVGARTTHGLQVNDGLGVRIAGVEVTGWVHSIAKRSKSKFSVIASRAR